MEMLAENSLSDLRNDSVPTSPDEVSISHINESPRTMDEQSQSSQDSLRNIGEESIENIEKELNCENNSKENMATPEAEGEQSERKHDDSPSTTSSSTKLNIKPLSNGRSLPKSGKPMLSDLNKKMNKSRGKPKPKALVAMYQSQISDNKLGIKLCIKKSDIAQPKIKQSRKRSRKSKQKHNSDSEDSTREKRRKREPNKRSSNNNTDKMLNEDDDEPVEQGDWGANIPENVLYMIFKNVVHDEGCLPTLVTLGKVCSLWKSVASSPSLWHTLDLGSWTKDKFKTEILLKWLIEHRLKKCTDANMANWKVTNIQCVLEKMLEYAPELEGITVSGWKGLTADHLMFLAQEFKSLKRIDLSSINTEANTNKTAVGQASLCNAIKEMNSRLTHLYLAHNRLSAIPQIVKTLSTHCPNMILLDLSNVTTIATSHSILNIEQLQHGCKQLKILRITNSHINLNTPTLQEQMDAPGFPDLEELSVASLADESRLLNDECLQRILKSSTQLKLLDLRGCARLSHDCLIRLPTWDLKHLFLSGCSITRDIGSGLELIASKWAHSLIEFDLAWANVQKPIDDALRALAEKGAEAPLNHLNLCGSSVSIDAVKEILINCPYLTSINLASCRGLPRGVKRLIQGPVKISELRENLGVTQKASKPSANN